MKTHVVPKNVLLLWLNFFGLKMILGISLDLFCSLFMLYSFHRLTFKNEMNCIYIYGYVCCPTESEPENILKTNKQNPVASRKQHKWHHPHDLTLQADKDTHV